MHALTCWHAVPQPQPPPPPPPPPVTPSLSVRPTFTVTRTLHRLPSPCRSAPCTCTARVLPSSCCASMFWTRGVAGKAEKAYWRGKEVPGGERVQALVRRRVNRLIGSPHTAWKPAASPLQVPSLPFPPPLSLAHLLLRHRCICGVLELRALDTKEVLGACAVRQGAVVVR